LGDRVIIESCQIVFLGPVPTHLFRHFLCRIYCFLPQCTASEADYQNGVVQQYDRLKLHGRAHIVLAIGS